MVTWSYWSLGAVHGDLVLLVSTGLYWSLGAVHGDVVRGVLHHQSLHDRHRLLAALSRHQHHCHLPHHRHRVHPSPWQQGGECVGGGQGPHTAIYPRAPNKTNI